MNTEDLKKKKVYVDPLDVMNAPGADLAYTPEEMAPLLGMKTSCGSQRKLNDLCKNQILVRIPTNRDNFSSGTKRQYIYCLPENEQKVRDLMEGE